MGYASSCVNWWRGQGGERGGIGMREERRPENRQLFEEILPLSPAERAGEEGH